MATPIRVSCSFLQYMVLGVVPEPKHMDDLEPFYRQHRLLGSGILIGGLLGLALFLGALVALELDAKAAAILSAAWMGPIAFGLLWRSWGAAMMQRHSADQMNE